MGKITKTPISKLDLDLANVNSLQDYLLKLACVCISMNTMSNLHEIAIQKGIFDDDEIEKAKTIVYQVQKMMISINDIISMTCARTNKEWPQVLEEVMALLPKRTKSVAKAKKK